PGGRLAEVCAVLLRLGDELELIRPSLYRNVARQLNVSPHSETAVTSAFLAVAAQIFSAGVTWGKVVSLYSVAAGLAVDCVRQAQPAVVPALVDCLGEFVHKTLASWLRRRGGWVSGVSGCRPWGPGPPAAQLVLTGALRGCGGRGRGPPEWVAVPVTPATVPVSSPAHLSRAAGPRAWGPPLPQEVCLCETGAGPVCVGTPAAWRSALC
ncbi:bcl-2-related ovarian killer protein, partial [Pteropus alecto]